VSKLSVSDQVNYNIVVELLSVFTSGSEGEMHIFH